MWQQIKKVNEDRGVILKDMRAILTGAEQRTDNTDLTAEERAKFDDLSAKAEKLKTKADDLQRAYDLEKDIESRNVPLGGDLPDKPGNAGQEQRGGADDTETRQAKAFDAYLRTGAIESRSLTISGMGVVGVRGFASKFIESQKHFAGVRQAGASVFTTTDGNDLVVPTGDDTGNTGRLNTEGGSNTNVTEPTLGNVTLNAYKVESDWIKISREMLADSAFDPVGMIIRVAAKRVGRKFNTYFTTGTGSSQPQGFAGATVGKTLAATGAVTYDELIDFIHSVDYAYRGLPTTALQLNDNTLAAIRKLKDGDNRYIWLPGTAGAPDRILGYTYVVNNDMADLGAGNVIAAWGDWEAGYAIRDIGTPEVIRVNELFAQAGLVGFNVVARGDGKRLDSKAIKTLKCAAS